MDPHGQSREAGTAVTAMLWGGDLELGCGNRYKKTPLSRTEKPTGCGNSFAPGLTHTCLINCQIPSLMPGM